MQPQSEVIFGPSPQCLHDSSSSMENVTDSTLQNLERVTGLSLQEHIGLRYDLS
jgi:hypothetical protein